MHVQGVIFDNTSSQPIPAASITILNSTGNAVPGGVQTDDQGFFAIDSTQLDQGGKVMISSIGYQSIGVDPNVFNVSGAVGLDESSTTLQPVVVTATLKKTNNAVLFGGLGAAALLLFLSTKKKKKGKVGAIDIPWSKIAIGGTVLVGGYFLVIKPILQKLGILSTPNAAEQATLDAQAASLAKAKADAAAQGKQAQTYADDQYTGWANDIYASGTADPVNQLGILTDVTNVNTDVDLQLLIKAFGLRQWGGFACANFNIYCTSGDLPTFLKIVLDASHIGNINQYFSAQGINYQL